MDQRLFEHVDHLLDTETCSIKLLKSDTPGLKYIDLSMAARHIETYLERYNSPDARYKVTAYHPTRDNDYGEEYILIDVVDTMRRNAHDQLIRKRIRLAATAEKN